MDKTKNYLDLSKCTEGERKIVRNTLYKNREYVPFFTNLFEIDRYYKLHFDEGDWLCGDATFNEKTELTYPDFIKLFEGGESKEVLQVENNEWIKSIAISHQKQMSSTHPHAIIGTIEDAIIEALETFKSNQ